MGDLQPAHREISRDNQGGSWPTHGGQNEGGGGGTRAIVSAGLRGPGGRPNAMRSRFCDRARYCDSLRALGLKRHPALTPGRCEAVWLAGGRAQRNHAGGGYVRPYWSRRGVAAGEVGQVSRATRGARLGRVALAEIVATPRLSQRNYATTVGYSVGSGLGSIPRSGPFRVARYPRVDLPTRKIVSKKNNHSGGLQCYPVGR